MELVIEIISTNDQINQVVSKMSDYRSAGVQVVWHVFPEQNEVHVYKGSNLEKMEVKRGKDLCNAAPTLKSFKIKVEDLLKIKAYDGNKKSPK